MGMERPSLSEDEEHFRTSRYVYVYILYIFALMSTIDIMIVHCKYYAYRRNNV